MTFSKHFKIENKWIGNSEPCFIVAEVGLNHNGDPELAKAIIKTAKENGADAVKFQKRDPKAIFTKNGLNSKYYRYHSYGETYGEHRANLELPENAYRELKKYADELGIIFYASAWDKNSADFLETLDVPAYKIASADLTNLPLIEHIAKKGEPVIMSTGMSTMEEAEQAVKLIQKYTDELVLLHCVSTYPSEFAEINLKLMNVLKEKFDCLVGYSGHELAICITEVAVGLGASMIERHCTINRAFKGADHAASLEPRGLALLTRDVRDVEESMGNGVKRILPREEEIRKKLAKSIVAARDIAKGEMLTKEMFVMKSPALGLEARYMSVLIGKVAVKNIRKDEYVTMEDVK